LTRPAHRRRCPPANNENLSPGPSRVGRVRRGCWSGRRGRRPGSGRSWASASANGPWPWRRGNTTGQLGPFRSHPGLQAVDQRPAQHLPRRQALLGGVAIDPPLDVEPPIDALGDLPRAMGETTTSVMPFAFWRARPRCPRPHPTLPPESNIGRYRVVMPSDVTTKDSPAESPTHNGSRQKLGACQRPGRQPDRRELRPSNQALEGGLDVDCD
jgi:hypothetical protein